MESAANLGSLGGVAAAAKAGDFPRQRLLPQAAAPQDSGGRRHLRIPLRPSLRRLPSAARPSFPLPWRRPGAAPDRDAQAVIFTTTRNPFVLGPGLRQRFVSLWPDGPPIAARPPACSSPFYPGNWPPSSDAHLASQRAGLFPTLLVPLWGLRALESSRRTCAAKLHGGLAYSRTASSELAHGP